MTFLSKQSFDADGKIKTIKSKRKILETVESTEEGILKGQARVKFEYDELTRDDLTPVDSLESAEALVLEEGEVFWSMGTPPLNHIAPEDRAAHRISTAAASIADRTKRGPGNTVICHPSNTAIVEDCWERTKTVDQYLPGMETPIKVAAPYFPNGPLTVFEDARAPEDKVLVIYRGADDDDQPLIYVEGEGLIKNSKVVDVENYGRFVRLT
jgi:hypothetical protein